MTSPTVRSVTAQVPEKQTLQISFSQTSWSMSSKHFTSKAARAPYLGDRFEARRDRAGELAEPHQLHAVVMRVAGAAHRRAEAADHADRDPLAPEDARGRVRAAEAVLDREHDRVGAERAASPLRRRPSTSRALVAMITRSHGPASAASRRGVHAHRAVAGGALDAQAPVAHRRRRARARRPPPRPRGRRTASSPA